MTDPVARDRLAALLDDAAMAAWLDHLNPQAPWPMDSMLFIADRLLAAGVLPPDTLAKVRAEVEAEHLFVGADAGATMRMSEVERARNYRARVLATLDRALEAASGTPEPPADHEHYWTDAPDDETGWHCTICGLTEYPGMKDEVTPNEALGVVPPPAAPGLREAIEEAIRFLNVLGDPIAAYLTLVAALDGEYPKPKAVPVVHDPAAPCTCGHRRDHHTNRDVDDVVGWPCLDCRSKRCRGFALAETPGEPE